MGDVSLLEKYVEAAKDLMPQGQAWPRENGTWIERFLRGCMEEFVRIHEAAEGMLDEADPSTAVRSLSDWERVVKIPDEIQDVQPEVGARRADIIRKFSARGGQSAAYFKDLARLFGYEVDVTEYKKFRCGVGRCGDRIWGLNSTFYWKVIAPAVIPIYFRSGSSSVGDALRTYRNEIFEAAIRRAAPAHTTPIFIYGGDE